MLAPTRYSKIREAKNAMPACLFGGAKQVGLAPGAPVPEAICERVSSTKADLVDMIQGLGYFRGKGTIAIAP